MTSNAPLFSIRVAIPADLPFIVDSWLRSFGEKGPAGRHAIATGLGDRYVHDYTWLIRQVVGRVPVAVACLAEDPETIIGWACASVDCVHYVFVKKGFRRIGIAKALLAGHLERTDVSYASRTHRNVRIPKGWTYEWMQNVRALAR